jgi:hypothetical protein
VLAFTHNKLFNERDNEMTNKAKQLKAELDTLYDVKRMLNNKLALQENCGLDQTKTRETLEHINTEISDLTKLVA